MTNSDGDYLALRLRMVGDRLLALVPDPDGTGVLRVEADTRRAALEQRARRMVDETPSLAASAIVARAGLASLEEEILWIAVAFAVDPDVSSLVSGLMGRDTDSHLTPRLVLRLFGDTADIRVEASEALSATGRLTRLGLIEWEAAHDRARLDIPFVAAPFVASVLAGTPRIDDRIASVASLERPDLSLDQVSLSPAGTRHLRDLSRLLARNARFEPPSQAYQPTSMRFALVTGPRGGGKTLVCRAMAGEAGAQLLVVDAGVLETLPSQLAGSLLAIASHQARALDAWLLLDGADRLLRDGPVDAPFGDHATSAAVLRRLLDHGEGVMIVTAEGPDALGARLRDRVLIHHELRPLDRRQAAFSWEINVPASFELAPDVDFVHLSDTWPLSGRGIQNALRLAGLLSRGETISQETLVVAAAAQQLRGFGSGARRTWIQRDREDLVLADPLARQIDEIISTERVRETVQQRWGMGQRLQKGLGIVCLFDGDPGTGKTLAAEVIASELALPLYVVNVSQIVSKWIGETEKNLQRIFDEARTSRCVLLFDEADTLFSKRTDVQRSVDRYSNMEVGLLLQLVENHPGLIVLTTNLKESLDPAFQRRITFKVNFSLPDAAARERIWRRVLPEGHLAPDLDVAALAKDFELSGGSIRTVALRASYRAAMEDVLVSRETLAEIATQEMKALGRLVRETRK